MEGILLMPPDRGTIIGRAAWKSRFIVVGTPPQDTTQPSFSLSQVLSSARIKDSASSTKASSRPDPEGVYLTIYKAKDDCEIVQQHSLSSITECQVQMISHRKQGPVLPTLCIHISPDPATDKLRKRRSSRTAGLTSSKDSGPTTLWMRRSEDHTHELTDWARYIGALIQPRVPDHSPMSPISPGSPSFINPFGEKKEKDGGRGDRPVPEKSESFLRGQFSRAKKRATMSKSTSQAPSTQGDQSTIYTADSPSLRSRRSDISSSHASSSYPAALGITQNYTTMRPSDIPSPASTICDNQDQFIEGWTSAQGRASTMNSSIARGRESRGSSHVTAPLSSSSSSPPGPRETILDRAFQLRYIPGAENEDSGGEHLSSLARFEALMRDAESRRVAQEKDTATIRESLRSAFEEDDSSEGGQDQDDDSSEEDSGDDFPSFINHQHQSEPSYRSPEVAERRSSVQAPRPRHVSRNSLSYHEAQGLGASSSALRPQTAHTKPLRPTMSPRTSSHPHVSSASIDATVYGGSNISSSRGLPEETSNSGSYYNSASNNSNAAASQPRSGGDSNHNKRHSTSSAKRLSFNEFTKRLSSSSSLLLVQSNASTGSGSNRGSAELEVSQPATPRGVGAGGLQPRGAGMVPPPSSSADRQQRGDACGWRGSVGVFGANEGGFL